ncbi:MAG: hypothetical protein ABI474_10865 [Actinomycetota bacterium]
MAAGAAIVRSIQTCGRARARARGSPPTAAWNQSIGEYVMADEGKAKTPLDALQDTLSRLKEMAHYSQTNIEKLAVLWLEVSEDKEQKQYEKMIDEVLKRQNQFQEAIAPLIEAYEKETVRLKGEAQ